MFRFKHIYDNINQNHLIYYSILRTVCQQYGIFAKFLQFLKELFSKSAIENIIFRKNNKLLISWLLTFRISTCRDLFYIIPLHVDKVKKKKKKEEI